MKRSALVAGATGLIGRNLLERLLKDPAYTEIRVLARRPLDREHPRLRVVQSDFKGLSALGEVLGAQDIFCCLGTTLHAAGSRAAFEDVDYRMVVELAQASLAAGAQQFLVISAAGASVLSPSFYSRVKGRMEAAVSALGFDAVHILRPSLLLGARAERRPAEDLAQRLSPVLASLMVGPLTRYRPIAATEVAESMLGLALRGQPGVHAHYLPLSD